MTLTDAGANLMHDRGGEDGLDSNLDFDSDDPGDQMLAADGTATVIGGDDSGTILIDATADATGTSWALSGGEEEAEATALLSATGIVDVRGTSIQGNAGTGVDSADIQGSITGAAGIDLGGGEDTAQISICTLANSSVSGGSENDDLPSRETSPAGHEQSRRLLPSSGCGTDFAGSSDSTCRSTGRPPWRPTSSPRSM